MSTNLTQLIDRKDLTAEAAGQLIRDLINPAGDPVWKGAILGAWACKGETAEELTGAARVILSKGLPLDCDSSVLDTCGTGGDGWKTFNISTATAIVVAACGVRVVKHGNRGVSSASGSADVLTRLGVNLDAGPVHQRECLEHARVTFCLAPRHYPIMAAVLPIRKSMGTRTIFNAIGPLLNPARARRQLLGVGRAGWLRPIAQAAMNLGNERTVCVHGSDGLDEITLAGPSTLIIAENGNLTELTVTPEEFGLPTVATSELAVEGPEASADLIREVFAGQNERAASIVLANASVALWTAGATNNWLEGVEKARRALASGDVLRTLEAWAKASQG